MYIYVQFKTKQNQLIIFMCLIESWIYDASHGSSIIHLPWNYSPPEESRPPLKESSVWEWWPHGWLNERPTSANHPSRRIVGHKSCETSVTTQVSDPNEYKNVTSWKVRYVQVPETNDTLIMFLLFVKSRIERGIAASSFRVSEEFEEFGMERDLKKNQVVYLKRIFE